MASLPPLGEVAVDVTVNLQRLLDGFMQGNAAADRFDRQLNDKIGQSLQSFTRQTNLAGDGNVRFSRALDQGGQSARRYADNLATARAETQTLARETETAMASIRRSLLASASLITAALGVNEIRNAADAYTSFANRIKAAGDAGSVLAEREQQLFEIAQRYGVQLNTVGALYGRMTQAQNELGASSAQIIRAVDGASAAVRIFGSSTEEQQGALLQLSQMLGDVNVRSQEFNSVNQGARPILQAAATGIERFHGSIAALRQAVVNQNVTSREFFQGWLRGIEILHQVEQANQLPLTLGASFTVLNNALGQYIGQTNQAYSVTQRISMGIGALANNLNVLMPILSAIVLAIGARYAAALGTATLATIRKAAADASATLAANALAASEGRVTTSMTAASVAELVTAAASTRLAASMGAASLAAGAVTVEVGTMSAVMATAGGLAATLGRTLLAAFGGWLGIAIMAVVGAVVLYERSVTQAKQEVDDFNTHQREANRLLAEEAQRGQQATTQVQQLGQAHQTATGYVTAFAGATGDAADQLHRQAEEARNARVELLRHAAAVAQADADTARQRVQSLQGDPRVTARYGDIRSTQDVADQAAAQGRAAAAAATAARLQAAADAAARTPLESWLSPNQRTQGRDIAAEMASLQQQLVAATRAHNTEAMRELNKQIRIRRRITEFLAQGLSMEIANAQAEAEALGARNARTPEETTPFQRPVAGGRITGHVGDQRPGHIHAGVDIAVPVGTSVMAAAGGTVIEAGVLPGYGNVIIIDHGRGTTTRYGHLSQMLVGRGATVEAGQVIARSGGARGAAGSGDSTGPHLHYEVRRGGRPVSDPLAGGFPADAATAAQEAQRLHDQQIAHDEAAARELEGLDASILQSTREQQVDAAEAARLERERINTERDREKAETEAKHQAGIYNETQTREIEAANERLRTAQLRAVDLHEAQRLEQEAARTRQQTQEASLAILEGQQESARTDTERRTVERQILAAQKAYERAVLQATIDSPFTTPIERRLAQSDMASLDSRYAARGGAINERTRQDLLRSAPEGSETAHRQQLQTIRDQEQERLKIVQEALDARLILEAEAARRRVEIEQDAQNQIREAQIATDVARLQSASETAASLQQIATDLLGEHSRAARAMFIVSKAFAIAEAVLQLQVALAKALALGFPQNIPAIASVAAIGASIISNIVAITAQFDEGGWTGGSRGMPAGIVHGEEFVVKAGPARQYRPLLETINSGRNPTEAMRSGGGGMMGGGGGVQVSLHNHAPGVEHEVRERSDGEIEIIARKVVARDAPGVIAADLANPSSRVSKAVGRHTSARRNRP